MAICFNVYPDTDSPLLRCYPRDPIFSLTFNTGPLAKEQSQYYVGHRISILGLLVAKRVPERGQSLMFRVGFTIYRYNFAQRYFNLYVLESGFTQIAT